MGDQYAELFVEVVELGLALGAKSIKDLPGCWEHTLDEEWAVALNGHNVSKATSWGPEVRPFEVLIMRNGLPVAALTMAAASSGRPTPRLGSARRCAPGRSSEGGAVMERVRFASLVCRIHRLDKLRLEALSRRTRIRQSDYFREALADLLQKYDGADTPPTTERHSTTRVDQVAVHLLAPYEDVVGLRRLSAQLRIQQAELVREAVDNLLSKYLELLNPTQKAG